MATKPPEALSFRGITEDEYYFWLGRFVSEFAATETYFHITFGSFARIDPAVAFAIKGGMRMVDLFDALRRILEINGYTETHRKAMNDCIQQFGAIGDLRNRILHQGAQMQPDGSFMASNFATARTFRKPPVQTKFQVKHLRECVTDLSIIRLCVLQLVFPDTAAQDPINFLDRVAHPWRYKGLGPNTDGQPRQKGAPES